MKNQNLNFDLEKIKSYDAISIKKDSFKNEVHNKIYTIEVNDNSYFYSNKEERNVDLKKLKSILKVK